MSKRSDKKNKQKEEAVEEPLLFGMATEEWKKSQNIPQTIPKHLWPQIKNGLEKHLRRDNQPASARKIDEPAAVELVESASAGGVDEPVELVESASAGEVDEPVDEVDVPVELVESASAGEIDVPVELVESASAGGKATPQLRGPRKEKKTQEQIRDLFNKIILCIRAADQVKPNEIGKLLEQAGLRFKANGSIETVCGLEFRGEHLQILTSELLNRVIPDGRLVVFIGGSGVGKTVAANVLQEAYGYVHMSTELLRLFKLINPNPQEREASVVQKAINAIKAMKGIRKENLDDIIGKLQMVIPSSLAEIENVRMNVGIVGDVIAATQLGHKAVISRGTPFDMGVVREMMKCGIVPYYIYLGAQTAPVVKRLKETFRDFKFPIGLEQKLAQGSQSFVGFCLNTKNQELSYHLDFFGSEDILPSVLINNNRNQNAEFLKKFNLRGIKLFSEDFTKEENRIKLLDLILSLKFSEFILDIN